MASGRAYKATLSENNVAFILYTLFRFSIFVTEQIGDGVFNKGRLMNTGFEYARAAGDQNGTPFDCFVFQDVDLLMENDKLIYK